MSPFHQIAIGLTTALWLGVAAVAADRPSVCSHVAELNNEGRLTDVYLKGDLQDGGYTEICADLNTDGRNECMVESDTVAGDDDLYLSRPDGEFLPVRRDPDETWSREGIAQATRRGIVGFEGRYYIVYGAADVPSYVGSIDDKGVLKIDCEFVQGDGLLRVASSYERLIRSAAEADLWETAFRRSGTEAAELLLANGHEIPESIDFMPALSWAISQQRPDAVEWLIQHDAKVNANHPADMPVVRAIWAGDPALAARLVQLGADPVPILAQLDQLGPAADSKSWRSLVMAAVLRVGYISEPVVLHAINRAPGLLDDLAQSKLTVQLNRREWHAGRQITLPFDVRADAYRNGSPETMRKLKRIYKRATSPLATDKAARLSYGSFESGLMIQRVEWSSVSDEDLLKFATSACIYFGMRDCGPRGLQQSARAWVETLHYQCPEQIAGVLSPPACNLLMHYLHPAKPPFFSTVLTYKVSLRTAPNGSTYFDFNQIQHAFSGKSSH